MLAEARGFRVGLTLAHQNLAQLPPELREGINTNARNKIMFSVSPDDATHLARHTLPELGPHDLAHLDAFHAAARLLHHGAETRAFTLTTRPLPTVRRAARAPVRAGPPAGLGRDPSQRPGPLVRPRRTGDPAARSPVPGSRADARAQTAELGLPTRAACRDRLPRTGSPSDATQTQELFTVSVPQRRTSSIRRAAPNAATAIACR